MAELQSFLGFSNAFRSLVSTLAGVAIPLKKYIRRRQPKTSDGLADELITTLETLSRMEAPEQEGPSI